MNRRRHPIADLAGCLLSGDPKRRIRLAQTSVAIVFTLLGLGVMCFAAAVGTASWQAVGWWAFATLSGCVVFFAAIRSGWSERFADPSLTTAQMLYAIGCCAAAYALLGAMRGAVFPLVMVVLMFGMFALPTRQVLAVSLCAVALFGAVMWVASLRWPGDFPSIIERGHFLMLAAMMPAVSVLAGRLRQLRLRLKQQKNELSEALARIQFLATRDDLTGLVNRRHIGELLDRETQRSARTGARFCVVLIDLDHFKRINDTHGHAAGDAVLRAFAQAGLRLIRSTDSFGRWGGEEFILLLADSVLPSAREAAERMRRAFEQLDILFAGSVLKLTLSAGIVQHGEAESVAHLIERADKALYRAKSQGRNAVAAG